MNDFLPVEFINVNFTICRLACLQRRSELDYLLCVGHFEYLNIYQNGQMIFQHGCNDWINEISVWEDSVAISTMDKEVVILNIPQR